MNRDKLIRQFAAENGILLRDASKYVDSFIDIIEEGLMSYGIVKLRNHFTLKAEDVPEKTIWSNLFNKYMKAGGYRTVNITVHKEFFDRLNALYKRSKGNE